MMTISETMTVHQAQELENRAERLWKRWQHWPVIGPMLWRRYLRYRQLRYLTAERCALTE